MSDNIFDAIQAGDLDLVKRVIGSEPQRAAARNADGVSAILLARYYGRREIADLLEATGTPLDIFEASACGRTARVRELLARDRALVNTYAPDGFTPLGLAAFFGHREIVQLLLEHGADVNGASRNATGYTALTAAATRADLPVLELLLEHGARVNHRYGPGFTPLHAAAGTGNLAVVRALVDKGAQPASQTDDGKTPRQIAVEKGFHEIADWLVSIGG